jgi:hypothetical protein
MSDTPWTKGPWHWRYEEGPQWRLAPGILLVEGGMTDGTPMGDAVDRANASLIAAAPDMAEALEVAIDLIDGDMTGLEWKQACRDFVASARAIIAKAKGATA